MKCTRVSLQHKGKKYTLTHCVFLKRVHMITVKGLYNVQMIMNHEKKVLSYAYGKASEEYTILQDYVVRLETNKGALNVNVLSSNQYDIAESNLHFKTAKHTFTAIIKEEPSHYSVKTGGKDFVGCVEIMIDKPSDTMKLPSLSQIYSEPECWYKSFDSQNDIVDLIKGSLQLCQMLLGTSKFILHDKSAIECGDDKNLSKLPPRKMKRPLSLAPLSFIKYCKTWYELNFNASIYTDNVKIIETYQNGIDKLHKAIDIPFDRFVKRNRLDTEQVRIMEPLYEFGVKTWFAFFNEIPKKRHCDAFFNWLPTFVDEHIMGGEFYMNRHKWIIDLGEEGELVKPTPYKNLPEHEKCKYVHNNVMIRTDMYILTDPEEVLPWKGGRGRPFTERENPSLVKGLVPCQDLRKEGESLLPKALGRGITRRRKHVHRNEWKVLSFSNDILHPLR